MQNRELEILEHLYIHNEKSVTFDEVCLWIEETRLRIALEEE